LLGRIPVGAEYGAGAKLHVETPGNKEMGFHFLISLYADERMDINRAEDGMSSAGHALTA
jgi:hypothetical protein